MKWVKSPHVDPNPGPTALEKLHEFRNPTSCENATEPYADHMITPGDEDDTGFAEGATC